MPRARAAVAFAAAVVVAVAPLTLLPAAGAAPSTTDDKDLAKIEPSLLAALEDSQPEDLVIEFDETADLTEASRIDDWADRGAAVVDALRGTARASQAEVVADLRARGADFQSFWVNNTVYVEGGSETLARVAAAEDDVTAVRAPESVELEKPDKAVRATQRVPGVEWGIADIRADQVWEQLDVRGEDVVVASIDSGAQFDHPALVRSYRGNLGDGSFDHDYNWFDPAKICGMPSLQPCDNIGHGTHTIGTMVGDDHAGNQVGVAPGARWISAKGCEFDSCSELGLTSAAQWILAPTDLNGQHPDPAKRSDIVNNSWSGPGGNDWYREFVRAWVASGIFPVFSIGNEGAHGGCETAGTPGEYVESYAVGNYTSDGTIASSSSRGPGSDGQTKPDIAAPGTDVRSSVPTDGYAVHSGTSMAAPHVAGTVALLWSAAPSLVGDVDATRRLLDDTARDTADSQCGGDADDNNVYGEGRLDAFAVVSNAPVGDVGTLRGTVTDAATGEPIVDADIAFSGSATRSTTTGADGAYSISLTAGSYDIDVSTFGFGDVHLDDVSVVAGEATTRDVELTPSERVSLTGVVTDGSGHGWPLYAKVSVLDSPLSTFTDPETGAYSLQVPAGDDVRVRVEAQYPGYTPQTKDLALARDTSVDLALEVDPLTCTAPGYRRGAAGLHESFDSTGTPDGWTVVDHGDTGQVWTFDDPGGHGNLTGGTGGFAVVDSDDYGTDGRQDTSLVSPVVDLSEVTDPVIEFGTDFKANWFEWADVDISVDGGATWSNVWRGADDVHGPELVRIPVPEAAHQPAVQVRFHYRFGSHDWWWQVDDVFVGAATCEKAPGALLVGQTTSTLAGTAVNDVDIVSETVPADRTSSSATPQDDALGDGFYWLFSSTTRRHTLTASAGELTPQSEKVRLQPDSVTRQDFALGSGRLEVDRHTVDATVAQGRKAIETLTIANTGDRPASYHLVEREDDAGLEPGEPAAASTPDIEGSARRRRIPADISPLRTAGTSDAPPRRAKTSAESPWTGLAPYPTKIKDSAAGVFDGRLYSFGGSVGDGAPLTASYVYDEAASTWEPIADLPQGMQKPAGAFIDGKFVVTGGWGEDLTPEPATSIYDPSTDSWSAGAPNPSPLAAPGTAVLDGMLYVVGGCAAECGHTDVLRYDPAADAWTRLADYPQKTAWTSCGGIAGKVYCAGGIGPGSDGLSTYAYDPEADSWEQVADMPLDMWASAYSVVDGRLVVSGGAAERSSVTTNETFAYHPADDRWSRLPSSHYALYRSAGACGFFKVGGSEGRFPGDPAVERLPGLTDCARSAEIGWLRTTQTSGTLKPGKSRTIRLFLDGRTEESGTYTANLRVGEDTPYSTDPVTVKLTVSAPRR